MPDFETIIRKELDYFESVEQRKAFSSFRVAPIRVVQRWGYSDEEHECFIVARIGDEQIVYCSTGFGPSFPWSVQRQGESNLGMDSQWQAYLYESFVCSGMWPGRIPSDFMLMGPGERQKT